jgi:hypothetical protein
MIELLIISGLVVIAILVYNKENLFDLIEKIINEKEEK